MFKTVSMVSYANGNDDAPAGGQPGPSTSSAPSTFAGTQPTNAPPLYMPPFPWMPFLPGFLPNALPGVIPFIMPPVPPQQQQPGPQVAHLANAPQSQQASGKTKYLI
nr:WW domain-binding protein 11-like [Parasteatoda tepidariorum]